MPTAIRSAVPATLLWVALFAVTASAQAQPRTTLPQEHDYQKVLYKYMASVTEADLTHGLTGGVEVKDGEYDPEYLYRNHIYAMMLQPLVGSKRGVPAITAPPIVFTLPFIEVKKEISTTFHNPANGQSKVMSYAPGVYRGWCWPEVLMSFVKWDYPGNQYLNNRALKMRAFMSAAPAMMMFHDFAEHNDQKDPSPIRPDWHGYSPIWWAYPYPDFKDVLPPDVQKAYETGLKMIGERMLAWGIRGESCESDYKTTVGLLAIARAIDDAEFLERVEAYTRPLYTDPGYFHEAGYWDERGGIETGFAGTANWFAAWTGLMTDWPFVKDALDKVYYLRRHLILPEPDGRETGPSHFNSRLGSPAHLDQWAWDGTRDAAVAMLTDQAAQFVKTITDEELQHAAAARARLFNFGIGENIRIDGHYLTNEEMQAFRVPSGSPWVPRLWMTYNFPASVNPGYEHYRKGTWAHRRELEKADSPLLKSPFVQGTNFVRAFGNDFLVARQPGYAVILHTGPVGMQTPDERAFKFAGPLGLGGGQVSAFWTPKAGPTILGLRVGMSYDKAFDKLEEWRTWPLNAVSGVTAAGKVFTSARNARPQVEDDISENAATVKVSGRLVAMKVVKDPDAADQANARDQMFDEPLDGKIDYVRTFEIDAKGVNVTTTLTCDGKDTVAELYETIPVYLGTGDKQKAAADVKIEFQTGGEWKPAAEQYAQQVTAVRITRFGGAIQITFARPRRVKLSPAEWRDPWINEGAMARNVMVDLLENGDQPAPFKGEKKVAYRIEPVTR